MNTLEPRPAESDASGLRARTLEAIHERLELKPTPQPAPGASAEAGDLACHIVAFNEAALKLQQTHERLHDEVASLRRELSSANERLERSRRLAALGEMAAGIAHEIRNPLGSIALHARMLEQDLGDRPPSMALAGKIARAVRELSGVVNDVLAFAREYRVRPVTLDLADLAREAVEQCLRDGPAAWQRVAIDTSNLASVGVEADEILVRQAIINVVRNAFEAMERSDATPHTLSLESGVRTERRRSRGASEPSTARPVPSRRVAFLSVRDSGPGLAGDVTDRMFNPFFTTRSQGTGLGLAIVHRILDAHGGRVAAWNNAAGRHPPTESKAPASEHALSRGKVASLGDASVRALGACFELVLPIAAQRPERTTTRHRAEDPTDGENASSGLPGTRRALTTREAA
ncbi:MAG: ATP-binding protein [Planctomycetota bacterium]|nr:ATP-binding protein [Planctomycetota bacterium]